MLKLLSVLLLLTCYLFAQKVAPSAVSEETFLNFESVDFNTPAIYIDDETSLAWQNNEELHVFKEQLLAYNYCKNLKLGDYHWSLPTRHELNSLRMHSNINFGHEKTYLSYDRAVWDNLLIYAYDAQEHKFVAIKDNTQALFVRCVTRLAN